ncbi:hypothetical protein K438DRAFT_1759516 [Mycena galopus ATCC 62051]|nr:hypothetical protein K438DRAFT_1759516 [Mycena galopus ATCC 62051]
MVLKTQPFQGVCIHTFLGGSPGTKSWLWYEFSPLVVPLLNCYLSAANHTLGSEALQRSHGTVLPYGSSNGAKFCVREFGGNDDSLTTKVEPSCIAFQERFFDGSKDLAGSSENAVTVSFDPQRIDHELTSAAMAQHGGQCEDFTGPKRNLAIHR